MPASHRRQVAVIGAGVAGLTAAYILQQQADVTLYEADGRLGGHAHTHELVDAGGLPVSVDTGFLVHNPKTYPHLLRLFAELDVATQDSEMSMSICCAGCGLQYAGGKGLAGIFPDRRQRRQPALPAHAGRDPAVPPPSTGAAGGRRCRQADAETMGEFLRRGRFSGYFQNHFVTPLISAVWSCAPQLARDYPARYLLAFLDNHGMLSMGGSHQWRTVVGGSQRYVDKAVKHLSAVQTATPVRAVTRQAGGVQVRDDADECRSFDAAVIATHPNQALAMLGKPTALQARTLGAIGYSVNPTLLHTDTTVLPRATRARACWNYAMPSCAADASAVRVSYDLNRLQRLDTATGYLVTLNAEGTVRAGSVLRRMDYEHPIYTPESVAAQRNLPLLSDSTARLRRRLPRLGVPRGRLPIRCRGRPAV